MGANAVGNAGNINIITGSLSLTHGSTLQLSTIEQTDAGSVNINARDREAQAVPSLSRFLRPEV
ncbi:hypothetical protein [Scytonema sp. NUACC26]|uniref:hypothetical protein n=1 Tax=Scytonema sp. NUACC26 TaxID=3140176 RepID=UPI0038B2A4A2